MSLTSLQKEFAYQVDAGHLTQYFGDKPKKTPQGYYLYPSTGYFGCVLRTRQPIRQLNKQWVHLRASLRMKKTPDDHPRLVGFNITLSSDEPITDLDKVTIGITIINNNMVINPNPTLSNIICWDLKSDTMAIVNFKPWGIK